MARVIGFTADLLLGYATSIKTDLESENMENLKQTISKLHQGLTATGNVDPELKAMLETLDQDIHLVLRKETQPDSGDSLLEDRARLLAAKFAAEHPTLEPMLREIADMLGKMGI